MALPTLDRLPVEDWPGVFEESDEVGPISRDSFQDAGADVALWARRLRLGCADPFEDGPVNQVVALFLHMNDPYLILAD